jgi:hypothetical protein
MTFVLQNIFFNSIFVFKLKFCLFILMDKLKLPYGLKRGIIIDAIDSTRFGKPSLSEWAEGYLYYQEVSLPGERDYVYKVASYLEDKKRDFDPYSNGELINSLMNELDEV